MYFGLFALAIALTFSFYGSRMVKKGREVERASRLRPR